MNSIWVLVCDLARARFLEVDWAKPWRVVSVAVHDESREKASELTSDRAGQRSAQGASVHHDALATRASPKENAKRAFARSLVATLEEAQKADRFHDWVLVAPPHALGVLKKDLTTRLSQRLLITVTKDLTHHTVGELMEKLADEVRTSANRAELS